jgi:hypothetical protein
VHNAVHGSACLNITQGKGAFRQPYSNGTGHLPCPKFVSLVGQKENGGKNKGDLLRVECATQTFFCFNVSDFFLYSPGSLKPCTSDYSYRDSNGVPKCNQHKSEDVSVRLKSDHGCVIPCAGNLKEEIRRCSTAFPSKVLVRIITYRFHNSIPIVTKYRVFHSGRNPAFR